jgi:putative polyhydroxyalkanoate system protein
MAKIKIERDHTMKVEDVKTKIDSMMSRMKDMGVESTWEGDTLKLKGRGVNGNVDVGNASVLVNLDLGMPASLMKGKIEEKIRDGLDKHLA